MGIIPVHILFILLLIFTSHTRGNTQKVEVVIQGIRSAAGEIVIGVYKDETSFNEDNPFERIRFGKAKPLKDEMNIELNLAPGVYGLALLDDENKDDKMNFNIVGIPQEGFGFSNYYHKGLTRPKFKDFSFIVKPDKQMKIQVKLKYM